MVNHWIIIILVGGFNQPLWKMMDFVNGKDIIAYIMENNPFMFETTNQYKTL